jgi:hypothetical protein
MLSPNVYASRVTIKWYVENNMYLISENPETAISITTQITVYRKIVVFNTYVVCIESYINLFD